MNNTLRKKWWLAIIIFFFLWLFPTSANAAWNEKMLAFLLDDLTTFWSSKIDNFVPPQVEIHTTPYEIWNQVDDNGAANVICAGATITINTAGYCTSDHTIHLDIDGIDRLIANVAKDSNMDGDSAALFVVAHEYAHSVQNFAGSNLANPYKELQADCMAGYYFHHAMGNSLIPSEDDLDEFATTLLKAGDYDYDSSYHHGYGMRRLNAFMSGVRGDAEACIQADF